MEIHDDYEMPEESDTEEDAAEDAATTFTPLLSPASPGGTSTGILARPSDTAARGVRISENEEDPKDRSSGSGSSPFDFAIGKAVSFGADVPDKKPMMSAYGAVKIFAGIDRTDSNVSAASTSQVLTASKRLGSMRASMFRKAQHNTAYPKPFLTPRFRDTPGGMSPYQTTQNSNGDDDSPPGHADRPPVTKLEAEGIFGGALYQSQNAKDRELAAHIAGLDLKDDFEFAAGAVVCRELELVLLSGLLTAEEGVEYTPQEFYPPPPFYSIVRITQRG